MSAVALAERPVSRRQAAPAPKPKPDDALASTCAEFRRGHALERAWQADPGVSGADMVRIGDVLEALLMDAAGTPAVTLAGRATKARLALWALDENVDGAGIHELMESVCRDAAGWQA